jgi:hypothetical protein
LYEHSPVGTLEDITIFFQAFIKVQVCEHPVVLSAEVLRRLKRFPTGGNYGHPVLYRALLPGVVHILQSSFEISHKPGIPADSGV